MKLIVGLGNPGKEYENTRHNIGFMFIDGYLESKGITGFRNKMNGLFIKAKMYNQDIIFLKPQSFINLSGHVIREYMSFYKIDIDDVFIISDDLDLLVGNYKLKAKGSSGGHNGLKDIERMLSSQNYKRLKIGIANNKNMDTKDYVLGKLKKEDKDIYANMQSKVNDIIDDYLMSVDFSTMMSKYNTKNK